MPIHLLWGDDEAARSRAVDTLINQLTDPAWQSINLSRLDGSDASQAAQALEEARTPPFGGGDRVVVLQRSPFCNQCPAELAEQLEATLPLIPGNCHLLLVNAGKPDARLRTTKAMQKLVKAGEAKEQCFQLPAIWDGAGQIELVQRTARELGLTLEHPPGERAGEAGALCRGPDGRFATARNRQATPHHCRSRGGPGGKPRHECPAGGGCAAGRKAR
jgi:DNA polymerase III subunit delta